VSDMNAPEPLRFGEVLRFHRVDAGLSQEALAARAGLSARAISALEYGANQAPRRSTLNLLAVALRLDAAGHAAFEAAAGQQRAPRAAPVAAHRNRRRSLPVPVPLTRMIGRERELAEVCALVGNPDVRLLTLVGPCGVGKTRLALQVASDTQRLFPGGATFVSLDGVAVGDAVLPALARALGLDDAGAAPRLWERVVGRLRRPELLVLDTFEHIMDAASALATLCESCPALTVLVTSRRALRLRGEHQFTVPPLETPPSQNLDLDLDLDGDHPRDAAVRLFVERLCAVNPAVPLTNAHMALIARACLVLDGLPLAIELAAAAAERLPLRALLDRLIGPAAGNTGGNTGWRNAEGAADAGVAAGDTSPCPAWPDLPDLEVLGCGARPPATPAHHVRRDRLELRPPDPGRAVPVPPPRRRPRYPHRAHGATREFHPRPFLHADWRGTGVAGGPQPAPAAGRHRRRGRLPDALHRARVRPGAGAAPVASCQLPVASCQLPVASCQLPVASCQLPVKDTSRIEARQGTPHPQPHADWSLGSAEPTA